MSKRSKNRPSRPPAKQSLRANLKRIRYLERTIDSPNTSGSKKLSCQDELRIRKDVVAIKAKRFSVAELLAHGIPRENAKSLTMA